MCLVVACARYLSTQINMAQDFITLYVTKIGKMWFQQKFLDNQQLKYINKSLSDLCILYINL